MSTAFQIRPIQTTDTEALLELNAQLGYALDRSSLERQLEHILQHPDHHAWLAEREGQVLGYVHGQRILRLTTPEFTEIVALVVDEKARRTGVAAALVQQLEQSSAAQLRVRCQVKRSGAHRFYENQGYRENKEQKVFIKQKEL